MKKIDRFLCGDLRDTVNQYIDAITELQEAVKKLQEGICITTPFTSDGNKPYKAPETQDDREEQPREEKAPI